jgi:hypothetical protein
MKWKLPEGLKPTQHLIMMHAENTILMNCSLRRLASGSSASPHHLNQTASRGYRCNGDWGEMDSLPDDSSVRWMVTHRGKACSPSDYQPRNPSSRTDWNKLKSTALHSHKKCPSVSEVSILHLNSKLPISAIPCFAARFRTQVPQKGHEMDLR